MNIEFSRGAYTYHYRDILSGTDGGMVRELFRLHGIDVDTVNVAAHQRLHGLSVRKSGKDLTYLTCMDERRMLFGDTQSLLGENTFDRIVLTDQSTSLLSEDVACDNMSCKTGPPSYCANVYGNRASGHYVVELCPYDLPMPYQGGKGVYLLGPDGQYRHFGWVDAEFSHWACAESRSGGRYTLILDQYNRIYGLEYSYDINISHGEYLMSIEGYPEKLKIQRQEHHNESP